MLVVPNSLPCELASKTGPWGEGCIYKCCYSDPALFRFQLEEKQGSLASVEGQLKQKAESLESLSREKEERIKSCETRVS